MSIWQAIWKTVLSEFSDIADVSQLTVISLHQLIAATLAGLLGYGREQKGKTAELRTHMLVALGAVLFVLIPQQAGASVENLTRVLQGLVAGVGFLWAGAIIMGNQKEEARGMTAAIGAAAGSGRKATPVLTTCLASAILYAVPTVAQIFKSREGKTPAQTGSGRD